MKHALPALCAALVLSGCVSPATAPRIAPTGPCAALEAALVAEEQRLAHARAVRNLPFFVGTLAGAANPVVTGPLARLEADFMACQRDN